MTILVVIVMRFKKADSIRTWENIREKKMNRKTMTLCLFGGAMFSAGVANAQHFIIQDEATDGFDPSNRVHPTFTAAYVFNTTPGEFTQNFASGGMVADSVAYSEPSSAFGEQYMRASLTSTVARVEFSWDGGGTYGYGGVDGWAQMFFQVDQEVDLLLSWDVSNTDGRATTILYDQAIGIDGILLGNSIDLNNFQDGGPLVGSEVFHLEPGIDYGLLLAAFGLPDGINTLMLQPGSSFIEARLVPSPGSLGLLGVAGIAAVRRRRA